MSHRLYIRQSSMQRGTGDRLAYRFLRDFMRDDDGGPLVEFTIIAPMLFIMMFGIIEWGNIFYVENNMLIAARQAVREVAVGNAANTSSAAVALACGSSSNPTPITGSGYTYTFTVNTNTNCAGASSPAAPSFGNVSMTITTPAVPVSLFNYLGTVTGLNLSASATMQQEFVCPAAAATGSATSQKC
jgi:Flp pilus assembly protein TadG